MLRISLSIFEKIKEFFSKRKIKLLQEKIISKPKINSNNNDTTKQEKEFKENLKENVEIHAGKRVIEDLLQEKNTYYEDRILQLIEEFKELYIRMLRDKNDEMSSNELFSIISRKTKSMYPELENKINEVSFYYSNENDSEEKLYYMLNLYKVIKEKVYGN